MSSVDSDVLRGFLSVFGGKVGIIVTSLIFTPIIVRILGPDLYGNYAYILSFISILTLVSNVGFNEGVRKFVAEHRGSRAWIRKVFFSYLKFSFVTSGLFALVLILWVNMGLQWVFNDQYHPYIPYLGIILIANQSFQISRFGLMGMKKERYSELLNVGFKVGASLFGIILAAYNFGVEGVLSGHIISAGLAGLIGTYLIHNWTASTDQGEDQDVPEVNNTALLSYGVSSFSVMFLTSSLYHIDIILLGNIGVGSELGFYKSALVVAELVWFVPQAIQIVLVHSTSKSWKENRLDKITDIASKATRYTFIFASLCSVGLYVLADEFIVIYFGESFAASAMPLKILIPGVLFFSISRPIFAIGQGSRNMRKLIVATGCAALINLILNLYLIPKKGMIGAAIATSIGYGSMTVLQIWAAFRMGYNPIADIRIIRIILSSASTYMAINYANTLINSRLLSLFIVPILGFIIYVLTSVFIGLIQLEEVESVIKEIKAGL